MQSMGLEDALKSSHLHLQVTEQVISLKSHFRNKTWSEQVVCSLKGAISRLQK